MKSRSNPFLEPTGTEGKVILLKETTGVFNGARCADNETDALPADYDDNNIEDVKNNYTFL